MALHTRTKILDAFLELANQYPDKKHFTFTEIAKEAGVSRQAIYKRHFNSVEEITNYIRQKMVSQLKIPLPISQTEMSPFDFFAQAVIPSFYQQRHWMKSLYTTSIDSSWRAFLSESIQVWALENLAIQHQKIGLPEELSAKIFAEWLGTLIENWMIQDEPLSPQEFADIFLNLVSNPLISFTAYDKKAAANKIMIP